MAQQAFFVLHRHELFHFLVEISTTFMELATFRPIYKIYLSRKQWEGVAVFVATELLLDRLRRIGDISKLMSFYAKDLEEALANAYVIKSSAYRRPFAREIKSHAIDFMKKQPKGYCDFDIFREYHDFAYGKRLLGRAIYSPPAYDNFYEILFNVEPEECLAEVPLFIVHDYKETKGHIKFMISELGLGIAVYPGDHPPSHIHVRIPPYSHKERKYIYPDFAPMSGSMVLSNKERRKIDKLLNKYPQIKKELDKIGL